MAKNEKSAASLVNKLTYWRDYNGTGDEYRRLHDLDCIQTGGNLNADTIISLWLPLRYTMNQFQKPKWELWKEFEYQMLKPCYLGLKDHPPFLDSMIENIDQFLEMDAELTQKLITLFELGQRPCNVMLLPKRCWNTLRGGKPYWDYFPHFLFDLFAYSADEDPLRSWLDNQCLHPFFAKEIFAQDNILDLAETGSPCKHNPREINLNKLLDSYIAILLRRSQLLSVRAA